jgi:serine/threonine protein phosphatase PrpC
LIRAALGLSVQGLRPLQEDFVIADGGKGIFVVADGFGGGAAGMRAARTACEAVKGFLEKEAGDRDATMPFVLRSYFSLAGNVLFNALVHANRKVLKLNQGKSVHERGGASVLAGFLDGDLLSLANVGGCTAWLLRDGRAVELVIPRTLGRQLDPWREDPPVSLALPLMALGTHEDIEPEITEYRVRPGDWLLLHTDGLEAPVRAKIHEIQLKQLRPIEAIGEAENLIRDTQSVDNLATSLVIF